MYIAQFCTILYVLWSITLHREAKGAQVRERKSGRNITLLQTPYAKG